MHLNSPVPGLRENRPDVPMPLDTVLARLMAKEPEVRFQTWNELLDELRELRDYLSDQRAVPSTGQINAAQSTAAAQSASSNGDKQSTQNARSTSSRRPAVSGRRSGTVSKKRDPMLTMGIIIGILFFLALIGMIVKASLGGAADS